MRYTLRSVVGTPLPRELRLQGAVGKAIAPDTVSPREVRLAPPRWREAVLGFAAGSSLWMGSLEIGVELFPPLRCISDGFAPPVCFAVAGALIALTRARVLLWSVAA